MRRALCLLLAASVPALAAAGEFRTYQGHGGPVMDITVAKDGRLATASFDNAVGLWSGMTPDWRDGHRAAVNVVTFLPDERMASGSDDFDILLWEGTVPRRLGAHAGKVTDLAVSPDGTHLASASWDGSIGLWPLGADETQEPRSFTGHASGVNAVVFADDGRTLLSAGADGTLRHWDIETGASRTLLENGFGINKLILAPDESWLAYGTVDGATRVIDPATGAQIADFTLERRPILALARDTNGSRIAAGDGEGYIMVISTADWRIEKDFRATERGPIWALDFSADGSDILAAGLEPAVYAWPLDTMGDFAPIEDGGQSFLAAPETMENGERQFARKCSICHTLTPGTARRAGPSLYGLFGRRAGSLEDYTYSSALDGAQIIWDETTIDALFDEGPDHYVPGTKMPMQRITGAQDRADLVAYLRRATEPQE
ncbi:c-type cytochrome [Profundibacterium mesophilum]|uniref:WD domain G-beta repeat containing protein n=1 Tax=Profundibacterium mesophilum KAUST100406-0324 TaxID=1037889 RepID=A0A921TCQ0_9RHOB|nr:c-type cytochrome [Profundibacterium mesophilum]KAF0677370.1 WD domain G-beta repeat containing protein [Profundibacterium mesophilum KAUST100406-0324]